MGIPHRSSRRLVRSRLLSRLERRSQLRRRLGGVAACLRRSWLLRRCGLDRALLSWLSLRRYDGLALERSWLLRRSRFLFGFWWRCSCLSVKSWIASTSVPGGTTSSESKIYFIAFSFSARILLSVSFLVRILSRSMSLELLFGSRRASSRSSRFRSSRLRRSRAYGECFRSPLLGLALQFFSYIHSLSTNTLVQTFFVATSRGSFLNNEKLTLTAKLSQNLSRRANKFLHKRNNIQRRFVQTYVECAVKWDRFLRNILIFLTAPMYRKYWEKELEFFRVQKCATKFAQNR